MVEGDSGATDDQPTGLGRLTPDEFIATMGEAEEWKHFQDEVIARLDDKEKEELIEKFNHIDGIGSDQIGDALFDEDLDTFKQCWASLKEVEQQRLVDKMYDV